MARPEYETEADREVERLIMHEVCLSVLCTPRHLSRAYGLDYALVSGRDVVAFMEAKGRTLPFEYEDGYYISALKVMAAKRLKASFQKTCYLAVRFADGLVRWADFGCCEGLIIAGRWDRGDEFDLEPHQIIRWDNFNTLETFHV